MKAAIIASSVISPQHTHDIRHFPDEIVSSVTDRLVCIEPDYRELINPLQLRRMPRILKMGLATSQMCINRTGGINPDAIIIGTGLGCLDNLEKFLLEVLNSNEHVTSVLPFINSTHNAVAAQVAMLLKNHNYNITYCHRAFSFESALQDAMMHLEEGRAENILVGGIDECTVDFMKLHGYLGYWKKPQNNLQLLNGSDSGTIAGEGSASFMLSGKSRPELRRVILEDVHTFFTPNDHNVAPVAEEIAGFLDRTGLNLTDIDGVLLGLNGDATADQLYYALKDTSFSGIPVVLFYKHLCGEYYTSSAFAMWLGAVILEHGIVPEVVRLTGNLEGKVKNLLIYNHFRNIEHSLMLLNYGRF